jgi:hypothetical protein
MSLPPPMPYNRRMEPPLTRAATLDTSPPRWSVGGLFIDALGRRDFDAMADCLDPDVRFRGLIPPGPFEVTGAEQVEVRFRRWFGGLDQLEIVDATLGDIGPKLYLRWRVAMTPTGDGEPPGPARLVEQHVFATIDQRIVALDLLCSGFVPRAP